MPTFDPMFIRGPCYRDLQVNVQYITKVIADLSMEDLVALKVCNGYCTRAGSCLRDPTYNH